MKKYIMFCLFFLAISTYAYSGQANRIELTDGSVINGEIVSLTNGVYVVNTASFGEVKLDAAKVSKIEKANSLPAGAPLNLSGQSGTDPLSQVSAYKDKLMSNPDNAAIVTGLASDPDVQAMAKDPQIVEAAKSGDMQALMKNEKFLKVVNSSKLQETVKKIKQQ